MAHQPTPHRDNLTALELEQARLAVEHYVITQPGLDPHVTDELFMIAVKLAREAQHRHAEEVA